MVQLNYQLLDLLNEHHIEYSSIKGDILLPAWYDVNPDIEDNLYKLLSEPRKKRRIVGLGHTFSPDTPTQLTPCVPLLIHCIRVMRDCAYLKKMTYEDAKIRINSEAVKYPDQDWSEGFKQVASVANLFKRLQKDLGIFSREISPAKLARYSNAMNKLGKTPDIKKIKPVDLDLEERKKKARELSEAAKELKALKRREAQLKKKAAKHARELELKGGKYDNNITLPDSTDTLDKIYKKVQTSIKEVKNSFKSAQESKLILQTQSLIDVYQEGLILGRDDKELMDIYREIMENKDRYGGKKVAFIPTPKQYRFLVSPEDIVLYGGAAGGGKTFSVLMDLLRFCSNKFHRGLLIRKTIRELREIIDISREYFPLAYPGAKYNSTDKLWRFPSGASILFGYLDNPGDKFQYQGQSYTYTGFDELSQHDTPEGFHYVRSRLRRTDNSIYPYTRATANPGSQWVYDLFIAPSEPEVPFILPGTENSKRPLTVKFIPAKLEDNPYLDSDGLYRSVLESLPELERRQLLEGDWFASKDNMFPEFDIRTHVIDPFPIPRHWNKIAGLDYGYVDPAAGVWMAVCPEDGTLYVYDEFLERGLTGYEFGQAIMQKEYEEILDVKHPIDWSIFARTGHSGPSIAESMMQVPGLKLTRADKSREAGWEQIHSYLRVDQSTGEPKMKIFSSCKHLIRQLVGVKASKTKPNDINDVRNEDGHWDLLDALRYGIMSRPRAETHYQAMERYKQVNRWDVVNDYFSL